MTIIQNAWHGDAPKDPHLGILTSEDGEVTAIPPGAIMYLIENPSHYDGVIPLVLLKVSRKWLHFRCGCGRKGCTRKAKFKAEWTGIHPHPKDG